jgi:hypothetical protein
LRGNAIVTQGDWLGGRTYESGFERWGRGLLYASARHCSELFPAASALREMQLVCGGFIGSKRLA